MARAIAGWLARSTLLLAGAALLTFTLLRLAPGDPAAVLLGAAGDQAVGDQAGAQLGAARLRAELGLDQPAPVQFARWVGRMLRLDFGVSFRSRQPVGAELARRFPATALLAAAAFAIHALLAIGAGVVATLRAGRWPDRLTRAAAVLLAAVPGFVLAWLGLRFFTTTLPWYDLTGPASLRRLWLPALVLGLLATPALMRVVRASLLAELGQLYMLLGRAGGIGRTRLVLTHALRNALLPVIALLGMNLSGLLSGAVVIETIFSWPGIGRYAVESMLARDYPVVQGYVLLVTALVIAVTGLTDLAGRWLDPRLRHQEGL
ncbi:MAG TPA: ABC transporter permease [Herpetosiphonaceae bacterium]|nr:ABC transporter permease [Herpetosiphonaceae bacterium]